MSNVALALSAEFKETEIGPIPVDWDVLPLGELAEVKGGKRLPKGHLFAEHPTNHPYIRVVDFQNFSVDKSELKFVTDEDHEKIRRYVIRSEDVYISIAGTTGVVGMVPKDLDGANLTENAAKLVIKNRNQLLNRFLVYYLSSGQGKMQIEVRTTKTSQPKLALMRIRQIPIPLPPLPEQRRIAHVLNTIQLEIAAQDALIAAARKVKCSLMQRLFTYGPGAEPAPTKETEIGEIPEHWEAVRLDSLADLVSGGTPSKKRAEWWQGTIPWASPKDLKKLRLRDTQDYITDEALENGSRLVPAGAIFVVIRGMILAKDLPVAITEVPMAFNQDIKAILPRDCVDAEYLLYTLISHHRTPLLREIGTSAHGTRRIGTASLEALLLPLSEKAEQRKIAHILATADRKIAGEEQRKVALQALFKSMLHQLMTGQLRLTQDFETQRRKGAETQRGP